ncbi:ATP-dependent DNA helicase hus2/rqh1 [Fusarium oxysporum f. sp. albedinis]|nr:ATP-dependent DNA helicase hus2/rqh1 [Fusarium oxysporum f. sp. albedinis]
MWQDQPSSNRILRRNKGFSLSIDMIYGTRHDLSPRGRVLTQNEASQAPAANNLPCACTGTKDALACSSSKPTPRPRPRSPNAWCCRRTIIIFNYYFIRFRITHKTQSPRTIFDIKEKLPDR